MAKNIHKNSAKLSYTFLIAAFVAFAGISAIVVQSLHSQIENAVIVGSDGTPMSWDSSEANAPTHIELAAQAVTEDFVQYTSSVENTSSSPLYITHVASYLSTDSTTGFIPFNSSAIEYTFTPDYGDSWTALAVSAPANNKDGFKLEHELILGAAGSGTDTAYFRYKVASGSSTSLTDNFAVLTSSDSGSVARSTYTNTVATTVPSDHVAVNTGDENASDVEQVYVDPLGVSSTVSDTDTVTTVATTTSSLSSPTVSASVVWMLATLGVFAICFISFLVLTHPRS